MDMQQPQHQQQGFRFQSKQAGMSFLSAVVLLLIIGAVGNFLFKVVPVYIENYSLKKMVTGLQNDLSNRSVTSNDVKQMVISGMVMNNFNTVQPENITVTKQGGVITVKLDYTVQEHLMYNVSLLLSFADSIILNTKQYE